MTARWIFGLLPASGRRTLATVGREISKVPRRQQSLLPGNFSRCGGTNCIEKRDDSVSFFLCCVRGSTWALATFGNSARRMAAFAP